MKSSQRGYSLIEALISVAILGGVAAALAPAAHSTIRAATRIAASTSAAEAQQAGHEAVAQLFAQAISPGADLQHGALVGAPQSLKFHVLTDGETGPHPVRLAIDGDRLLLVDRNDAPTANGPAGASRTNGAVALMEGVRRFRYYGVRGADREPSWSDRWRETAPPRLVAVEFGSAAKEEAPAMIYFLASSAPSSCAFDQVSRRCRR